MYTSQLSNKMALSFILTFTAFPLLCSANDLDILQSDTDNWQFAVTPYIWAVGFDGQIGAGTNSGEFSPDNPFFTLENIDSFAFIKASATKGRYVIRADYISADYEDQYQRRFLTTKVGFSGAITDLGVGYLLQDIPGLELSLGWRFFDIDNTVNLSPGPDFTINKKWSDPYLGGEYTYNLPHQWKFSLRADIGGFGHEADSMTNIDMQFKRQFNDWSQINFGYKYLDAKFSNDFFSYDVALKGALLGISFQF